MKSSERQKLKHDAYAETMVSGLGWARKHGPIIAVVFAAVLLIIGVTTWTKLTRRQAAEAAQAQLVEAEQQAARALAESAEGREQAVRSAVSRFEQIAADYPKADAAAMALYQAGQMLARAGSAKDAIPYYERALRMSDDKPGLASLTRRALAGALERAGRPADALEQHRRFLTPPNTPQAIQAFWDMGRLHELLGEMDKAREAYQRAAEFGGDSRWAELARYRLAALAAGAAPLQATQPEAQAPAIAPTAPAADSAAPAAPASEQAPAAPAVEQPVAPAQGAEEPKVAPNEAQQ